MCQIHYALQKRNTITIIIVKATPRPKHIHAFFIELTVNLMGRVDSLNARILLTFDSASQHNNNKPSKCTCLCLGVCVCALCTVEH